MYSKGCPHPTNTRVTLITSSAIKLTKFVRFYNEFPSATFDSLVHLIHSGMTQQQRTDLLAALVSLEGQSPDSPQITSTSNADSAESGADIPSGDEVSKEEI